MPHSVLDHRQVLMSFLGVQPASSVPLKSVTHAQCDGRPTVTFQPLYIICYRSIGSEDFLLIGTKLHCFVTGTELLYSCVPTVSQTCNLVVAV